MEKQICDDFNCLPMISYFKVEQTKRCYGVIKICCFFFLVDFFGLIVLKTLGLNSESK